MRTSLKTLITIVLLFVALGVGAYFLKKNNQSSTPVFIESSINTPIDISGKWFTPHAAVRNIEFGPNTTFTLNTGVEHEKVVGTYVIDNSIVTLRPNNTTKPTITLYLSSGYFSDDKTNISYYLKNSVLGEYFVKSEPANPQQ